MDEQSLNGPQNDKNNIITFIKGKLSKDTDKQFKIGSSYKIEFYPKEFVDVSLIDANSNIEEYINIMSKDSFIFADFESSPSSYYQKNSIPINVFSFSCKSGIFMFQSTRPKGNEQLGQFLKQKEGRKIFTFGISHLTAKLREMFGNDLTFDIEDLYLTRIPKEQRPKLYDFIENLAGKPLISREVMKKAKVVNWSDKVLSMEHALRAAYVAYGLSRCYEKLPPIINEIKEKRDDDDQIEFNFDNDNFDADDDKDGQIMDYGQICFSAETFSKVYLLDAVEDFEKFIPQITKDEVIFVDFEYVPLTIKEAAPICMFQFCCSSGAFLFRQRTTEKNEVLKNFMSVKNGLKFVAKGIPGDMIRLRLFFGDDFKMNIEDVEVTRLMPYNEPLNFERMVNKFACQPTAEFKDKRISCSNWNAKNLSKIQVFYSAFDVVALYRCYPNYKPSKICLYNQPNSPYVDVKRKLAEYAISIKKFDPKNLKKQSIVDSFWDLNSNLVLDLINVDYDLLKFTIFECLSTIKGNNLRCKICNIYETQFFRVFLAHCKKHHFIKKNDDDDIDIKVLFMNYLNLTGRINLSDLMCLLCKQKSFKSENNLCQHCWDFHFRYVNEFISCPIKDDEEDENDDNDNDSYK